MVEFGSITCPVYRSKIGQMNELAAAHPEAQFVVIYTTEAHPTGSKSPYSDHEWVPQKNAKDQVLKPQSTGLKQRREYVAELQSRFGERRTIAVDDQNDTAWKACGAHPNSAFVVGRDGLVIGSMEWSDPGIIEQLLANP